MAVDEDWEWLEGSALKDLFRRGKRFGGTLSGRDGGMDESSPYATP